MITLNSIDQLSSLPGPVALAIGVFDGVHLGHQEVIRSACEHAGQHGGTAVVMTFDPHPMRVLRPDLAPRMLCCTRHKTQILDRLGVPCTLVCPFDAARSQTPAEEFIRELAAACRPLGFISVGLTWKFGQGGRGNIHLLTDLGSELGFSVYGVPPVTIDGEVVSSTLIREAVNAGDFSRAALLLGREYTVFGNVVEGHRLGRQIGFPTANLNVAFEQFPPAGVYAVRVLHRGEWLAGVANLGTRPTVAPENRAPTLEVHLFDWDQDLYGQDLEVLFVRHLRTEKRFSGVAELRAQIEADAGQARRILAAC